MSLMKKTLVPLVALGLSTSAFGLHSNKKEAKLPAGDVASQSIVKLIIGNSTCTGSFLSKRSILTAAHCVPLWATGENLTVITYDGSNPNEVINIDWEKAQMTPHPDYNFLAEGGEALSANVPNDLAVITLSDEIKSAKPVILFDTINIEESYEEHMEGQEGNKFYLAGNGSRQRLTGIGAIFDQIRSLTKQTTAELINHEDQTLQFKTVRRTKVCQGDSGGPAFKRTENGRMVQYGVVSIGVTGLLWAKICGRNIFYAAVGGQNLEFIRDAQKDQESK